MVISFLPDEIVSDILLRLPVKCLIRCTSVCKPWKSKIKTSRFIHTHLNHVIKTNNQRGTHLLLYHSRNKPEINEVWNQQTFSLHYDNHVFEEYCKLYFQIDGVPDCHFIVASVCNGVICLADVEKMCNYVLWNPSIRKAVNLPSPAVTFTSHGLFNETLAIWFDALTTDYKVVRIVTSIKLCESWLSSRTTSAEVYSLRTGSWRSLGANAITSSCVVSAIMTSVFCNGIIHWVVERRDSRSCFFILTFNVESEAFGKMMMPECAWVRDFSRVSVTGDGNSLALFAIGRENVEDGMFLDIWIMKEYGVQESWTKLMRLGPQTRVASALSFRKSGDVFLLQKEGCNLASLELASRKINNIERCRNKCYCSVNPYDESLVLLDVGNAISY